LFTSKQNLSKFYWHNINDLKSPFIAFIQHTNFVDDYGKHVYYMGGYYPQDHKYFKAKDEVIYKEFFGYLKKMFPKFEAKEVEEKWVFKFKNAQHVSPCRDVACNVSTKFIHMNFAQIYPQDRGMNYAIRMAQEIIKKISFS